MGVDDPSLYDQPGEIPQTFRDTVPPRAIPSTLVIDPDGAIAARIIGPTTYGQFTELLNPLVVEYDFGDRSEEHTSELQSRFDLVCRLLLEKKKKREYRRHH